MKEYKFANNMFYPYVLEQDYLAAGSWPEEGCDVSEAIYREFTAQAPAGKIRITGPDGMPAWGDIPPLTPEELAAEAEAKRQQYRAAADEEINWRQDAVDAGIATESEIAALAEWKKYRVLLMRVETAAAPDIVWPAMPAK